MSRIAQKPILLPTGVTVKQDSSRISVKGKDDEVSLKMVPQIAITQEKDTLSVTLCSEERKDRALLGTYYRLVENMVKGVTTGFQKNLEIVGVGYRVQQQGQKLVFQIGFCHPVEFEVPKGVSVKVASPTLINLSSADKCLLGQTAAQIRAIRPPEPYKGKGIKYTDEIIRRKAGKSFAGAGA